MENKNVVMSYTGMQQDITQSKSKNSYYFEGNNIKIIATDKQSTGSITNVKGNEFLLSIPTITFNFDTKVISYNDKTLSYTTEEINDTYDSIINFGTQIIIGSGRTRDSFIIFSTNNQGLDCIWKLDDETLDLTLLYVRNLGFNTSNPIQILNNYENNQIDKIYWVDGVSQMRYLNIHQSLLNGDQENLIDVAASSIQVLSDIDFTSPKIQSLGYGGQHTSGMIQYAYSLYKVNGAQTAISPMSELIPLGKSDIQGGKPNEIVGTIPKVFIDNIDNNFTNLKLYSIKYTAFQENPKISLIADRSILGLNDFTYFDDGRIIGDVSLEEFVFLIGKFIIPKHIESKDSRLFMFNYKDRVYDLDQDKNFLDVRAYSFPVNSLNTTVYSNISSYDEDTETPTGTFTNINFLTHIVNQNFLPKTHPAINGFYKINKYQPNSTTIGGEGPFLKYEISRNTDNKNDITDFKFFKDDELYRIAIQFYNKYGIKSLPKWIADFVTSSHDPDNTNLGGFYAGIKITMKPSFYVWLNNPNNFLNSDGQYDEFLKPVGFKILRADRQLADRSILNQSLINGMMVCSSEIEAFDNFGAAVSRCHQSPKMPSLMRRFDDYLCPMRGNSSYRRLDDINQSHPQCTRFVPDATQEVWSPGPGDRRSSSYQFNQLMQGYSPEIIFEMTNNIESNKLRLVGSLDNNFNALRARREKWQTGEFGNIDQFSNAISPYDVKSGYNFIYGGPGGYQLLNPIEVASRGLYGPQYLHESDERKAVVTYQYWREYTGTFRKNTNDNIYTIYGKPEITNFGASVKKYNNDPDLAYINSFGTMHTGLAGTDDSDLDDTALDVVMSNGGRTITFALGEDDTETINRPTIESLFNDSSMKDEMPGESGVPSNPIVLDDTVPTYADLLSLSFPGQIIGVLETGYIYANDDDINSIGTFDPKDVVYIFPDLASYDAFATSTMEILTNKRIAIVDHIDNIIYEVLDQMISMAGLLDTGETFDYLENLAVVDQYVADLEALNNLATSSLPDGYAVGVISNLTIYTLDKANDIWEEGGSFTVTGNDYKGGAGLIVEFINDERLKYIGNYYGGNSYEAKTKTVYVEASDYFKLNGFVFDIISPGDTFVQEYAIARVSKDDNTPIWSNNMRMTEVIKVRLESTVNQFKRDDESRLEFNGSFSPSQGDFHTYNKVYSQNANLIKSQDFSYEVKNNELFETGIIASRLKRPGELIDNFSILSTNDTMYLEGKYGAINAVVKYNDNIFTFQDNAIANISINPRVQIQGSDGVGIELGTGNVLHDYSYLSTESGTLNKWGVIGSNTGVYYYDTINNNIYLLNGQVIKLGDVKYNHIFFTNNINNDLIKEDNHILKKGIQIGYDYLNNDIYFTFHQLENSKTISFNENLGEFISLHDFKPSFYFNKGDIMLSTHPDNNRIYNHIEGIYNNYYDEYYPSHVIFSLNPEPYMDCVFTNINFKSEVYLNNVDQPNLTLTHIKAWNEYQTSLKEDLIVSRNGNIRRKFRDWNAEIPRDGRDRIRNPWIKLQLDFENENNKKLILHDTIISYIV
jgi:hypothetical protein